MDPENPRNAKQPHSSSFFDIERSIFVFSGITRSRIQQCRRPNGGSKSGWRSVCVISGLQKTTRHVKTYRRGAEDVVKAFRALGVYGRVQKTVGICHRAPAMPLPRRGKSGQFYIRAWMAGAYFCFGDKKTSYRLLNAWARFPTCRVNDICLWGHWKWTGLGRSYVLGGYGLSFYFRS